MPSRSPVQGLVISASESPRRPFSVGAWASRVVARHAHTVNAISVRIGISPAVSRHDQKWPRPPACNVESTKAELAGWVWIDRRYSELQPYVAMRSERAPTAPTARCRGACRQPRGAFARTPMNHQVRPSRTLGPSGGYTNHVRLSGEWRNRAEAACGQQPGMAMTTTKRLLIGVSCAAVAAAAVSVHFGWVPLLAQVSPKAHWEPYKARNPKPSVDQKLKIGRAHV